MWIYSQPTRIIFGTGCRGDLPAVVSQFGKRPVLVSDRALYKMDNIQELVRMLGSDVVVFSDVDPNPTVDSVDKLVKLIHETVCDVVVAVGGGSSLDCGKMAAAITLQGGTARDYHSGGRVLDGRRLPLVVMPTTAGTGSEITSIAVLDDPSNGRKAPIAHLSLFPSVAIIDPVLTVTMPPYVTACTGLDALSHAIEGYWSRNHQPICDLMACESVTLVFSHLLTAFREPNNLVAREGMCLAALLGGMAFHLPKNAAVHACSYPLSSRYHLPHGAACAMTLDHFIRFNEAVLSERGIKLAQAAGFKNLGMLADKVSELKHVMGLPLRLRDAGVKNTELEWVVNASFHPLMDNNPRPVSTEDLRLLYREIY